MQVLCSWIRDLTDYNLNLIQHDWDALCGLKLESGRPTLQLTQRQYVARSIHLKQANL